MPVYVRKNLLSITPDSLGDGSGDEDDYVTDPDQMVDDLPQPFRLINKVIVSIFDKAWDRIGLRERLAEEERRRVPIPVYGDAVVVGQYKDCPGVVESPDGTALFIGLPNDLIVLDPMTRQSIATWKSEDQLGEGQRSEVADIATVQIGVQTCLIISISKSGSGRLHIYSNSLVLYVKDLETEVPLGGKILEGTISEDGEYLGLTTEGKEGEIWLEIFKLPKDSWLKDIDNVHAEVNRQKGLLQNSDEGKGSGDSKPSSRGASPVVAGGTTSWNPSNLAKPTQLLRVAAPSTSVSGSPIIAVPKASTPATDEWISTIGVGKKHQLTDQHLQLRRTAAEKELASFVGWRPREITYQAERSESCRWLISSRNGRPASYPAVTSDEHLVCAWENTSYLSVYDLLKIAKDMERKPDRVVPFGADITALSLSPCGLLLAIGLRDSSLVLFDEFVGLPLFVERVGKSEVDFLTIPVSSSVMPPTDINDLRELSAGGVTTIAGTRDGCLVSLSFDYSTRHTTKLVTREASRVEDDRLQAVANIKSLHNVMVIMTKGGDVSMLDFMTGQVLCRVKVPSAYSSVNSFGRSNMISLVANGQQILLKATVNNSDKEEEEEEEDDVSVSDVVSETALLAYQLQSFTCLDSRWKTLPEQQARAPTSLHTMPLCKRVDWLLTKHLHDSNERQVRIQQRWETLKDLKQKR